MAATPSAITTAGTSSTTGSQPSRPPGTGEAPHDHGHARQERHPGELRMPRCPGGEVPIPAHDAEPVDDAELPGAGEQARTGRDAERVCPGPYRHAAQRTRPEP